MRKTVSMFLVLLFLFSFGTIIFAQEENVEGNEAVENVKPAEKEEVQEKKELGFFEGLGVEFNTIFGLVALATIFFSVKIALQMKNSSFDEKYLVVRSDMSDDDIGKLDELGKDVKDIEKKWVDAILANTSNVKELEKIEKFKKLEKEKQDNIRKKCLDYQEGRIEEAQLSRLLWDLLGNDLTEDAIVSINKYKKEKKQIPAILNIMLSGLLNLQNNQYNWWVSSEMDRAIENTTAVEFEKVKSGLDWLWAISGGAPMIGLFGTVVGISGAFNEIASGSKGGGGGGDIIQAFAPKISVALYTTIAGLVIGMTALVVYNVLKSKLDNQLSKVATFFTEITNLA